MGEIHSFRNMPDQKPHSVEAEQQILGALLLNNDLFFKVDGQLESKMFFDGVHAAIYDVIRDKITEGHLASPITLRPVFETHQGMNELGGAGYLAKLAGISMGSFAINDYVEIVSDLYLKRSMITSLDDARARINAGAEPATKIAHTVESSLGAMLSTSSVKPLIRSHLSSLTGAVDRINKAFMGEQDPGISTGLPQLDDKLGFLRGGNMVLLAGRPAMGKTTEAQNMVYSAITNGVGCFFASLEMTGEDLASRFISKGLAERGVQIPYSRMIKGALSDGEMRHVVEETKRQQALPLAIGERDVREVSRLRSAARRAQQQLADTPTPLGLIVIDYVQKIESDKARNSYDAASMASDMCKDLSLDLNVPVVALAQLSRSVEHRDPPIPMLSDLRDTGKLEEDADVVIFCYREAYYLQKELDALQGEDTEREADIRYAMDRCRNNIDFIVAKQRSGPTGTVRAYIEPGLCHVSQDRMEHEGHLI